MNTYSYFVFLLHSIFLNNETVFCDLSHGGYENVPEVKQLTLLPLGTIIPWVSRPALDSKQSVEEIPKGWQR